MLLTTWFPPKHGVAVNRMLGFARYMNPERTSLSVVTDAPEGAPKQEVVSGVAVIRVTTSGLLGKAAFKAGEPRLLHLMKVAWNIAYGFIAGPADRSWVRNSVSVLERIHAEHPIDVIISSYAPAGPHLLAASFLRLHPEVKWVADMRDEMSLNPHLSGRERRALRAVEVEVNRLASAVTSVSQPIVADFRRLLPDVRHVEEIRNGYDHELKFEYGFNPVFTIAYSGSFYGLRKPTTFFKGLSVFLKRTSARVKIRFIGVHRNFSIPPELEPCCEFVATKKADEVVREMAAADANLLVLPVVEGKGAFSGKIFEYLSVQKPIIAVVDPSDVAAGLIRELNAGFVADFNDERDIADAIEGAYRLWTDKCVIGTDSQKIRSLHRRYSVERLEKLIDSL